MKIPKELMALLAEMKGKKRERPKYGFLGSKDKSYEEAEKALQNEEELEK